jgi:hypothetical protein
MDKMSLRRKIARMLEDKILPNVMKDQNARSRGVEIYVEVLAQRWYR